MVTLRQVSVPLLLRGYLYGLDRSLDRMRIFCVVAAACFGRSCTVNMLYTEVKEQNESNIRDDLRVYKAGASACDMRVSR